MSAIFIDANSALPNDFAAAVRAGLGARQKRLPCRYLYDAVGSELFERICDLPEYTLTRDEQAILEAHAADIVANVPIGSAVVELGSGSARKTRVLLDALLACSDRLTYVPIDISRSALEASAGALMQDYRSLDVMAIAFLAYAGIVALCASRTVITRAMLMTTAAANAGYVVASALVLILLWSDLQPVGRALIAVVAIAVEAFAALQFAAGRRIATSLTQPA